MSQINSKSVAELRQKTGLGMMDCKKALEASNGDFEKAIDYLRKKGIAKGEERTGRSTGEGLVDSYIHPGGKIGVLIEVNCETDFVSRSEEFQTLVHNLCMQIAAANPLYVKREDVPQEKIDHEMEIYKEQMLEEKKPPEIIERISKGKLEKFFKETCLLEQAFVKDAEKVVSDVVLEIAGKLKENIQVRRFTRYALGD